MARPQGPPGRDLPSTRKKGGLSPLPLSPQSCTLLHVTKTGGQSTKLQFKITRLSHPLSLRVDEGQVGRPQHKTYCFSFSGLQRYLVKSPQATHIRRKRSK